MDKDKDVLDLEIDPKEFEEGIFRQYKDIWNSYLDYLISYLEPFSKVGKSNNYQFHKKYLLIIVAIISLVFGSNNNAK